MGAPPDLSRMAAAGVSGGDDDDDAAGVCGDQQRLYRGGDPVRGAVAVAGVGRELRRLYESGALEAAPGRVLTTKATKNEDHLLVVILLRQPFQLLQEHHRPV